jgi:hypothetical protein
VDALATARPQMIATIDKAPGFTCCDRCHCTHRLVIG